MKKALILTTISGFVPQFEMNNIGILKELGYEIHYASNFEHPVYEYDKELFQKEGIITHHIVIEKSPFRVRENFMALSQLKKIIREEQFDLIHCHNPMGGVLGRVAGSCCAPSAVILYTAHGFHFYREAPLKNWILFYPVERLLAHVTDYIITINQEDYKRASKFHLRKEGKVWQIPGAGLDLARFTPGGIGKEKVKRKLGFPENSFLMVSVGELNDNKNHKTVIKAMSGMDFHDLYYGICGRGKYEEKLRKLIRKKGLEDHVKLLGYREDIEYVLKGADCFLFPSKREGFGMAAVEAMAAGVAMITSDCRGTREYMLDGKTGIVCRNNAPGSYRRALEELRREPKRMEQMEIQCRCRANLFGWRTTDRIMRRVYQDADEHSR